MESIDHLRLNRALQMKFQNLLGRNLREMDRALQYIQRLAKEKDGVLTRTMAQER